MKKWVVDASIVLKWFLQDEEYGEKAIKMLDQYLSEKLDFCAPSLLEYEIINGLVIAQKRGRIKPETVSTAVEGFINLEIPMVSVASVYPRILFFCKSYDLSAYDAGYVAVAEQEKIPLITADARLYRNVRSDLKWVHWIGEA